MFPQHYKMARLWGTDENWKQKRYSTGGTVGALSTFEHKRLEK